MSYILSVFKKEDFQSGKSQRKIKPKKKLRRMRRL